MTTSPAPVGPVPMSQWVRTTWPLDRRRAVELVVALAVTIGAFALLGHLLTEVFAPNVVTRADDAVADWFVDGRTPLGDDLARWGSLLADTLTKVVLTAVVAVGALAAWRRWHEAVVVVLTLVFEATAFIVVTTIVGRPRPDVPRLEESPVNSSFPSGHVAAATVYGAFVVLVVWHTRSRAWRALASLLVAAVVVAVAWARLYEGMHHLSDVIAGVVLGLVSLAVCLWILGAPDASPHTDGVGDRDVHRDHGEPADAHHRVGTGSGLP